MQTTGASLLNSFLHQLGGLHIRGLAKRCDVPIMIHTLCNWSLYLLPLLHHQFCCPRHHCCCWRSWQSAKHNYLLLDKDQALQSSTWIFDMDPHQIALDEEEFQEDVEHEIEPENAAADDEFHNTPHNFSHPHSLFQQWLFAIHPSLVLSTFLILFPHSTFSSLSITCATAGIIVSLSALNISLRIRSLSGKSIESWCWKLTQLPNVIEHLI